MAHCCCHPPSTATISQQQQMKDSFPDLGVRSIEPLPGPTSLLDLPTQPQ
jgi:hypothetical protein